MAVCLRIFLFWDNLRAWALSRRSVFVKIDLITNPINKYNVLQCAVYVRYARFAIL